MTLKQAVLTILFSLPAAASAFADVAVATPSNGSVVGTNVQYVASASSNCGWGVAAVGIYVDYSLQYVANGSQLNASIPLPPGAHNTYVQAWDYCGGSTGTPVQVTAQPSALAPVSSLPANAQTITDIQSAPNWNQWGELAPIYDICGQCNGIYWQMTQNVGANSLSGHAARFDIWGNIPYSDVLWSNKIVGQGTTKNLPDNDRKILPNIRNLQYDTDVFITNFRVTQDVEFDVNMYLDGAGMEWGTECNHLANGQWDVWDPQGRHWVATGAPCSLNDGAWNHVTIAAQRLANNGILYRSITVNGSVYTINRSFAPFAVPGGWYGMTVNFQMDGNYQMAPNTAYLDNLTVHYW